MGQDITHNEYGELYKSWNKQVDDLIGIPCFCGAQYSVHHELLRGLAPVSREHQ